MFIGLIGAMIISIANATQGTPDPVCVDLLASRLDQSGDLQRIAAHGAGGREPKTMSFRSHLVRASSQRTIKSSLHIVTERMASMKINYVVIGPNAQSNMPTVDAELQAVPWVGVESIGAQLNRIRSNVADHYALLVDVSGEDLNSPTPNALRFWFHIRRIAEHVSVIQAGSITLFTTFENLSAPEHGKVSQIFDRSGYPVRFTLHDMTDRAGKIRK